MSLKSDPGAVSALFSLLSIFKIDVAIGVLSLHFYKLHDRIIKRRSIVYSSFLGLSRLYIQYVIAVGGGEYALFACVDIRS